MAELAKRTLLILLAVLFSVGSLEVAVRFVSWAKDRVNGDPLYQEVADAAIAAEISEDTFNIFYFGGSSMRGHPYRDVVNIPEIVSWLLDGRITSKQIRFVNLAFSGANIRDNLDRLRVIIDHRAEFNPSLFVIYSGHNEYLRFNHRFSSAPVRAIVSKSKFAEIILTRFEEYELTIDDRDLIDEPLVSQRVYESVIVDYRRSLELMLDISYEDNIPVLVSTVAGNYSDWSPNRSSFCTDESQHQKLRQLAADGARLERDGDLELAMGMYKLALSICPQFAEAHFALGRLQLAKESISSAWDSFQNAIDFDGMPFRATSMQNDFIRNLESYPGLIIVDAVNHLRRNSSDGALGYDLMIDAHHPNLAGYLSISELFAGAILEHFEVDRDIRRVSAVDLTSNFGIGRSEVFKALIATGRWMTRIATWRFDPNDRLARADLQFQQASEIYPDSYMPPLGRAMVAFLQLRVVDAEKFLDEANYRDEKSVKEYLGTPWINLIVKRAYELEQPKL